MSRSVIAGTISGVAGAFFFGIVLWWGSPDVISSSIPGFYNLPDSALTGWLLHVMHGAILGIVFGVIVSRRVVFEMIAGPVETDILANLTANVRFGLLGIVYGIAIWMLLPFIGLSLLGALADMGDPGVPGFATDMIIGHVLFGVIVGLIYSLFIRTSPHGVEG